MARKPPSKKPDKKTTEKKAPEKKMSRDWQMKAGLRAFNGISTTVDDLLSQFVTEWANGDPSHAVLYLFGAIQAMAGQTGRIEAILTHSGYLPPSALEPIVVDRLADGFNGTVDAVHKKIRGHGEKISIEALVDILHATSLAPKKKENKSATPDNVVNLPIIKKESGT